MAITHKIFLRTDNKNGTNTVSLRISKNRKSKYFSLRFYLFTKDWNVKKNSVKKSDLKNFIKNKKIAKYDSKADSIETVYFVNEEHLSFSEFEKQLFNNLYGNNSLYEFIENKFKNSTEQYSPETTKTQKLSFKTLKKIRKELSFREIDFAFLKSYQSYLLTDRKNKNISANRIIKLI